MEFPVTIPNRCLTQPLLIIRLLYLFEPCAASWKQFDRIVLYARRRMKKTRHWDGSFDVCRYLLTRRREYRSLTIK